VRVTRVVQNSPAEAAGVSVGDVIRSFDGTRVDDPGALDTLLRRAEPGREAVLELQRDDTVFELRLPLAAAGGGGGEARPLYRLDPARSRAGWATGERGVVLVSAAEDGPTGRAGLELGAVVLAVDGEELLSARDLIRELGAHPPGDEVTLTVLEPGGGTREVELRLQDQGRRLIGAGFPILFHYDADPSGGSSEFVLLDLWLISLFSYEREGSEKEWRILRFIRWSTGVGELSQ
jgi:S1-C subfamily serine protease